MDFEKLSKFLADAKKSTYAKGEGKSKYSEGDFDYTDNYHGESIFIGQEIVFEKKKAVWGMNYYGMITEETAKNEEVFKFLRKALMKVEEKKPFRGPENFDDKDFSYSCNSEGDLNKFYGVERIFYKGLQVFKLEFNGGILN